MAKKNRAKVKKGKEKKEGGKAKGAKVAKVPKKMIPLKFTVEDKEKIRSAAVKVELSMARFCRDAIMAAVREAGVS